MKPAIIVLGHGSRREDANEEIREIAGKLAARDKESLYQVAFFQFGEPSLGEALKLLVESGVNKIIVLPLFLTVGSHIHQGIPEIISRFQKDYPGLNISLARHLGADPLIIRLLEERIKEVTERSCKNK
ncbi:MAG: cobalamin biosynthesis protein CbiX [Clostridia bacterium]|nr:cobalamin biosynthesis protein CbiX [Clostridia bacterium]